MTDLELIFIEALCFIANLIILVAIASFIVAVLSYWRYA
jgi:hypothetical protein